MLTDTMPTRWSDDPREDFDRCPDHFKDAVAQVMDGLGVPNKGEMADGWRQIGRSTCAA